MARFGKLVPMIVSCPIFLQNIDLSAMNVALPSMARSMNVPVLHLNPVISAYAISLAAFLPLSAWIADRFGEKRTFCSAIVVFSLASTLCGAVNSPGALVLCRILQGLGAAMMVPVGRLILIRSVPAAEMISAMVWFTIPPAVGRMVGPLVGGAIVTLSSWRWVFFVNIPLGLITLILALKMVPSLPRQQDTPRFDIIGFMILGTGLGALLAGLETTGRGMIGAGVPALLVGVGGAALVAYVVYSLRQAEPLIDLRILRYDMFRTNVLGALPFRLANAASPFLLSLMLQLVCGFSAVRTGAIATGAALGALGTRAIVKSMIGKVSLKKTLLLTTLVTSIIYGSFGLYTPLVPQAVLFGWVLTGGLITSLCMISLNTLGFVEIPPERTSHGTALLAMVQQSSSALGIVMASSLVGGVAVVRGGNSSDLVHSDFIISTVVMGLVCALSLIWFSRLRDDPPSNGESQFA